MYLWMFNCKEVTRRASESLDRKLSLHERVGMRIHLLICKHCSRYWEQLLILREAIRLHTVHSEGLESSITLAGSPGTDQTLPEPKIRYKVRRI